MSELRDILASNIIERRKKLEKGQDELAKESGTTVTTISSIENSRNATNIDLLQAIARALKCEPDLLLKAPTGKITREQAAEAADVLKRFFRQKGGVPDDVRFAVFDLLMKS